MGDSIRKGDPSLFGSFHYLSPREKKETFYQNIMRWIRGGIGNEFVVLKQKMSKLLKDVFWRFHIS